MMPRSFAPEASGSLLQKFFLLRMAGLNNEVPENGEEVPSEKLVYTVRKDPADYAKKASGCARRTRLS